MSLDLPRYRMVIGDGGAASDTYQGLVQSVPEQVKTEDLLDVTEWLGERVRQVDWSLLDEWDRFRHPEDLVEVTAAAVIGTGPPPVTGPSPSWSPTSVFVGSSWSPSAVGSPWPTRTAGGAAIGGEQRWHPLSPSTRAWAPGPRRGAPPFPGEELPARPAAPGPFRYRPDATRVWSSAPLPLVEVDRVAYPVPPSAVGATVEIRLPVDAGIVEIRYAGELVAVHRLVGPGQGPVWDPLHRAAAEAIALAPHRRHLQVVPPPVEPSPADGLRLGDGDWEVAAVDMGRYDLGCGCSGFGA